MERRYFLGTLSAAQAGNWDICKDHGLWGSGGSSGAKHAARHVRPGDIMFVWRSKQGLMAAVELTSAAHPVTDTTSVPWPTPEKYTNTFSMSVRVELDQPIPDRFQDYRSVRFRIQLHQVQNGFIRIEQEQAELMADALDLPLEAPGPEPPAPSAAGRAVGAIYLRPATSVVEAMLDLWRSAQEGPEEGDLLVIGSDSQRSEFERHLAQAPFVDIAPRFRFSTPAQIAEELERATRSED